MLQVILLPARDRSQGFVDAHNLGCCPLLGRFSWLGRYSAYRAGTRACGRVGGSNTLAPDGCDFRLPGVALATQDH
jgi:hypothetical protein